MVEPKSLDPSRIHRRGGYLASVGEPLLALVREEVPSSDGPGTWATAKLVRYADDFVVLARYQSSQLVNWIERLLEGRFQLTVNREKTRM